MIMCLSDKADVAQFAPGADWPWWST